MKSKTSCFNLTIFKKNITHYWPLWAIYLCWLAVTIPLDIYLAMRQDLYVNMQATETQYDVMYNVIKLAISPGPVFLFAVVMAMAVFSYLYTARNANMIHALPVNRLELFVTNYASGLLFLLAPQLLTFVASVLVCMAMGVTCIQYLFLGFLYMAGMAFFAFSLAVFTAMFTGQLFAVPAYYLIANYLYVGCLYLCCALVKLVSFGISDYWNPGVSCILSPIYYLGNNLKVREVYGGSQWTLSGLEMEGGHLVAVYAAAAIVIVAASYQLYKRRQLETAGDLVSIGIVKPVFRWGAALGGGFLLSIWATEMLEPYNLGSRFATLLPCVVVFGFVCFFVAQMLLEKSFRVFTRKRAGEWAAFTAVAVVFLCLFKLDVFGIESYVPDAGEVQAAFVYMDYPLEVSAEELASLHSDILSRKGEYLANFEEGHYYYTTLRYYMKDGSTVSRRYPLALTEESRADGSPTARVIAWESRPEALAGYILGYEHESSQYYGGSIDLYAEDGRSKTYEFTQGELDAILSAAERDIEEGRLAPYYLGSLRSDEAGSYVNGISLSYFSRKVGYSGWELYDNYWNYLGEDGETMKAEGTSSGDIYLSFGEDCVNLVGALKELGVVDGTWKLMTYEEYERYVENL